MTLPGAAMIAGYRRELFSLRRRRMLRFPFYERLGLLVYGGVSVLLLLGALMVAPSIVARPMGITSTGAPALAWIVGGLGIGIAGLGMVPALIVRAHRAGLVAGGVTTLLLLVTVAGAAEPSVSFVMALGAYFYVSSKIDLRQFDQPWPRRAYHAVVLGVSLTTFALLLALLVR